MSADPLRVRLAALVADWQHRDHAQYPGELADELAALLREPPEDVPLESELPVLSGPLQADPVGPIQADPVRARLTALPRHWAVTVSADGEPLVTIETNCLSGRDLTPDDEDVIQWAAHHLLAFIGRDAALRRESPAAAPLKPSRLVHLAQHGARLSHAWYFDAAENIDEDPPAGHAQPFDTCPHPDCRLVRDAARAAAPKAP